MIENLWDDLRRAAEEALRNVDLNIRLSGDGTSQANLTVDRTRMYVTIVIALVVGFLAARAFKK